MALTQGHERFPAEGMSGSGTVVFVHASGRKQQTHNAGELAAAGGVPLYVSEIAFCARRLLSTSQEVHVAWHSNTNLPDGDRQSDLLIVVGEESGILQHKALAYGSIAKTGPQRHEQFDAIRSPTDLYSALLSWMRQTRNAVRRRKLQSPPLQVWRGLRAIPLGCSNTTYPLLSQFTLRPTQERTVDISFYGDIGRCLNVPFSTRGIPITPKALARTRALSATRQAKRRRPDLIVDTVCSGWGMGHPRALAPNDYLSRLANTKICLCPRGNFRDTFRHYEAAAMGCVVLCDRQERSWYAEKAPFIVLDSWADATNTLLRLLSDPVRLAETADATRRWWTDTVNTRAVADRLVQSLGSRESAT